MSTILSIALAASIECSVASNSGVDEYSRFYNLTYRETGVNEEGLTTAEANTLTETQKSEAWSCLLNSAEKKYCGAVALLQGCYENGWQQDAFRCAKDNDKHIQYSELRKEICPS